jgi:rhodanese-related sulfurtransferase
MTRGASLIFDKRFFREAAIIVGLSAAAGLAVNIPLIKRCMRGELDQGFISAKIYPGVVLITVAEAEDLFAGGGAVFLDARPESEFREGRIAGAMNVPFETTDRKAIGDLVPRLPAGKSIVVYCAGGDCLSSLGLARLLVDAGVEEVRVFLGGWAEWTAAGLPGEKG